MTGLSIGAARRLIKSGRLTVQKIPGSRPLVLRSEVERLIKESTSPARP